MLKKIIILAVLLSALSGRAAIFNAASCSFIDVSNAVKLASDKDQVIVPAGSAMWLSGLLITNDIWLMGQGAGQTIIVDGTEHVGPTSLIRWLMNTNGFPRMSGFTFASTNNQDTYPRNFNGCLYFYGLPAYGFRIDHCLFTNLVGAQVAIDGWAYGVIDHNNFVDNFDIGVLVFHTTYGGHNYGDGSWADDPKLGSTNVVCIENNFFNDFNSSASTANALDTYYGGRVVFRFNYCLNTAPSTHGTESSGRARGFRTLEVYGNTMIGTNTEGVSAGTFRGGAGLVYSNTYTGTFFSGAMGGVDYRMIYGPIVWNAANTVSPWDTNFNANVAKGATCTSTNLGILTMTDVSSNWIVNQWQGYTIYNTNTGFASIVLTNGVNTIGFMDGRSITGDGFLVFTPGDHYGLLQIQITLDQVGRGKGDLIDGDIPLNTTTGTRLWPHEALEPVYTWSNTVNGALSPFGTAYYPIQEGRDFSNNIPMPGYTALAFPNPLTVQGPSNVIVVALSTNGASNLRSDGNGTQEYGAAFSNKLSTTITITHLGVRWFPGNTSNTVIRLRDVNNNLLASVTIDMSQGTVQTNLYAALASPVIIASHAIFFLDIPWPANQKFFDLTGNTLITPSADIGVLGGVLGGTTLFGSANQSWGVPSAGYSIGTQTPVAQTNFYVANSGWDGNPGTIALPLQHWGYAVSNALPGSTVFLNGGDRFDEDNVTIKTAQFTLMSYGVGRATLRNTNGPNILKIDNVSSVTISNIYFVQSYVGAPDFIKPGVDKSSFAAVATNSGTCILVYNHDLGYSTNITIVFNEMTNFMFGANFFDAGTGYTLDCWNGMNVSSNLMHDFGGYAIFSWSLLQETYWEFSSNTVTHFNHIYNGYGVPWIFAGAGSGIVCIAANQWLCYSNYVHDLGLNAGPTNGCAGIFPFSYGTNDYFRFNTISNVLADQRGGDGDGIDLDFGVSSSWVEANYVYNCSGFGVGGFDPAANNVIDWNLVINCGTNINQGGGISWDNASFPPPPGTNWIYNNTVVGGKGGIVVQGGVTNNLIVMNNILPSTNGAFNVVADVTSTNHLIFKGNNYPGANFKAQWGNLDYTTFSSWQAGSGMETGTGTTANPLYSGLGGPTASGYVLLTTSTLKGAGQNVVSLYSISAGTNDYLGNVPIASGIGNNIGGLVGSTNGIPYPQGSLPSFLLLR